MRVRYGPRPATNRSRPTRTIPLGRLPTSWIVSTFVATDAGVALAVAVGVGVAATSRGSSPRVSSTTATTAPTATIAAPPPSQGSDP